MHQKSYLAKHDYGLFCVKNLAFKHLINLHHQGDFLRYLLSLKYIM